MRSDLEHLERAKSRPVAFGARSNVHYEPETDKDNDSIPWRDLIISFKPRDYLHVIDKFNDDWWIGRLVKEDCDLGFIPSPVKLDYIRSKQAASNRHMNIGNIFTNYYNNSKSNNNYNQDFEEDHDHNDGSKATFAPRLVIGLGIQNRDKIDISPPPYDIVPTVRPLIFIGPSLKGFQVTDMMQKVIFDFLKHRFMNRIIITRVTADISLEHSLATSSRGSTSPIAGGSRRRPIMIRERSEVELSEINAEIERIFELSHAMQLVALDCDTINHPDQVSNSSLAPILVYLKVSSLAVLKKLIKSHDKAQTRAQVDNAEKLLQLPRESFDVILEETQLEEACEHLAEFLEGYWKAIHRT